MTEQRNTDSTARPGTPDLSEKQVRWFMAALVVYSLLQIVFRVVLSPTVELDEGEQVMHATSWSWGYFHNPPLYTWLQFAFFKALGVNVLALALLKNLVLLGLYFGVFKLTRRLGGSAMAALTATVGLGLVPAVAFLSQRDLTHSVLATALTPWTLIALWDLLEHRRTGDYLRLGVWLALGLLSKYLFFMLVGGLFGALLLDRKTRPALLDKRMLLTLAIPALAGAPHFQWLAQAAAAQGEIHRKLHPRSEGNWFVGLLVGWREVSVSALEFVAGTLGTFLIFGRKKLFGAEARASWPKPVWQLLTACGLLLAALLLIGVPFGFISDFKARWYLAAFFIAPLVLALAADRGAARACLRPVAIAGAALSLLTLVIVPARAMIGAQFGYILRVAAPFEEVARQLAAEAPGPRLVLASDRGWGGSWRIEFPEDDVRVPEYPEPVEVNGRPVFVVWEATVRPRNPDPRLPENLRAYAKELTGVDLAGVEPRVIEIPYRYGSKRLMRVCVLVVKGKSVEGGR